MKPFERIPPSKERHGSSAGDGPVFRERVRIGEGFVRTSALRKFAGVPIIYLPIFLLPFTLASALLTYLHLRVVGARNLRSYWEFVPDRSSYRYTLKTQILASRRMGIDVWVRSRLFWIFNCTVYCPYSVGLLHWHTYLVHVVENFWCPFDHSRKATYADGAIDESFWHTHEDDKAKLHPDDRDNPIWNRFCEHARSGGKDQPDAE